MDLCDAIRFSSGSWADLDEVRAQRRRFDRLEDVLTVVRTLRDLSQRGGPGSRRVAVEMCDKIASAICDAQNL